ncbi:hypothetical protein [Couchioplanes caeruleus]|uniref:Uncharacterized protein n=2 Tax=Couchioplanes caeruleus TaxID=56438 RepID=A0A1K0FGF2_9ACTN|nr:hypothetical protein [Couchioplanes caeruleus]OJF11927.1 hypothetical protein BG844_23490 [Couchioplanes caeruleus subsp. caeruleus]ROP30585.1 hypothetical protein EDD30_3443 [Couchioplanes caeruleus]
MSGDTSPLPFAGELFLTLANQGRLVVDAARADKAIADLERTLALIRSRLRVIRIWQRIPERRVGELPDELMQEVVDAIFVDQLAPGQLERAAAELPKYIQALRRASEARSHRDPPPV